MDSHETSMYLTYLNNGINHIPIPMIRKDYEKHGNFMRSIWGPPRFDVLDTFLLHYNISKLRSDNFYQYCEQGRFELAKK